MAPAAKPKAKKVNGYARPAAITLGTLLTDKHKKDWKVGPSIGSGGFGDIYACCSSEKSPKKVDDYPNVVKIEPHANGPLFVEMHFYARNCKKEDINTFRVAKGWKHLGMPELISHGSQDIRGDRHRFLIIPRFGTDIWKIFLQNNRQIPQHTVYRIGIQMINVLEYMHSKGYVHADIKGANILLGAGKSGAEQCYLVDFGLATHYSTTEYKPDPKKAHNGTIEYTSRDAHAGVATMRGDMEILGLNMVHWLGLDLPWESQKLLANPKKVQEAKEQFMKSLDKQLNGAPEPIRLFMKYVERMGPSEQPDYDKCRGYLEKGLKSLGKSDKGALEFDASKKGTPAPRSSSATKATSSTPTPRKRTRPASSSPPTGDSESPRRRKTPVASTSKQVVGRKRLPSASPVARKSVSSANDSSVIILDSPVLTPTAEDLRRRTQEKRQGKLIVNNNITPRAAGASAKKVKKTYQFDFELDVSVDADVVVNLKRKKREPASTTAGGSAKRTATTGPSSVRKELSSTPSTPVGVSPVVRKRIARKVKVTPSGTVRVEKD